MPRGRGKGWTALKVAAHERNSRRGSRLAGLTLAGAVISLIGALLLPAVLFARKKAKAPRVVSGEVLDSTDNPMVGASVELKDLESGKTIAMYTQQGGQYQFSDLDPTHDYEVQASYKGVSSEVRTASSFDTRHQIVLNLRIPPRKD